MASILQTDVLELYNTWGERVAFNEGFQAQKIAEAKQGGRDAFSLGIDRSQGQGLYFEAKDQRFSEAKEFLAGEPVAQISDESISDVESESIEPDQIGDVTDGEETLGMESVVANETEDRQITDEDMWTYGNDPEFVDDPHAYMQSIWDAQEEVVNNHYAEHASDIPISDRHLDWRLLTEEEMCNDGGEAAF